MLESLDSYCKRAPEVLVRLERPGRAKVGASQRCSASLAAPAKLPSMQSLRWCSITKDSKSGCAIFSAFSLTSKECHDAKKIRNTKDTTDGMYASSGLEIKNIAHPL